MLCTLDAAHTAITWSFRKTESAYALIVQEAGLGKQPLGKVGDCDLSTLAIDTVLLVRTLLCGDTFAGAVTDAISAFTIAGDRKKGYG